MTLGNEKFNQWKTKDKWEEMHCSILRQISRNTKINTLKYQKFEKSKEHEN